MRMRGMVASILVLAVAGLARADVRTLVFTPDPADLNDLDHHSVYEWGIDVALEPDDVILAAELRFDNIANWNDDENVLYTHLLDWAAAGVADVYYDDQSSEDYFDTLYNGVQTSLVTYLNLPSTGQDLVYTFSDDEIAAFNDYLTDQRVGIGFDPDCHFYNDGISLVVTVPEPATAALVGLGLLAAWRRR